MIIIFGYFISLIWLKLEAKNYINSSILKIAVGIIIMGSGFIFMFFASLKLIPMENRVCTGLFLLIL